MSASSFGNLLNCSVQKEQLKNRLGIFTFLGVAVVCTAVYLWRCQFGVDLTDEAFYALPPWKLLGMGDRPFVHEIFNGLRHSDLLNYLFVRPLVPFSLLEIRQSAVIFYALVLGWYVLRCFRGNVGLAAILVFSLCLTFDLFLVPSWSYNWWARNFLLLHQTFLLLARDEIAPKWRGLKLALAGFAMGIVVVAYNPLLGAFLGTAGVLALFRFRGKSFPQVPSLFPYVLGGLIPILIDLVYVLGPGVRADWLISVRSMAAMSEYSGQGGLYKLGMIARFIFWRPELWALLGGLYVFNSDAHWTEPLGSVGHERLARLRGYLLAPALCLVAYLFVRPFVVEDVLSGFVGLGISGTVVLVLWAFVHRDAYLFVSVVAALLVVFGVAVSSTNHYHALYWGMPALIVPFMALQSREASFRLKPFNLSFLSESYGHGLLVLFVGYLAFGAFTHQRTHSYYDVPPGNCDTAVSVPPLKGLKTSARRAFLAEELYSLVKGRDYVLSFADNPGSYLFSKVRPSVDTTIVETEAPDATNERSLSRMGERRRIPSLILKTKVHPWYWGIHHPLAREPYPYTDHDPYVKFTNCVKGETVASFEEFEAIGVDASKIESCLSGKRDYAWATR